MDEKFEYDRCVEKNLFAQIVKYGTNVLLTNMMIFPYVKVSFQIVLRKTQRFAMSTLSPKVKARNCVEAPFIHCLMVFYCSDTMPMP